MNGFLTIIPIILIRYGLLGIINKEALKRAAFFPPLVGREKNAFWIYQISTLLMLIWLLFVKIRHDSNWFNVGLIIYLVGLILYLVSIINYASPKETGINLTGLYQITRNPMYIAYFIYFLGCALLTCSWILLGLLIVFQTSSHWIILSEEKWCIKQFGDQYLKYMSKVRRYI